MILEIRVPNPSKLGDPKWRNELVHHLDLEETIERNGLSLTSLTASERAQVARFGADMKAGIWRMTGDAIIFDVNGKILDGRLRLLACYLHKTSFPALVITNIDPAAASTIGHHRKRRAADVLQIAGQGDPRALAGAVSAILEIVAGTRRVNGVKGPEVLEFVEEHPGIVTALGLAKGRPSSKHFGPGMLAALLHLTGLVDSKRSRRFFDELDVALGGGDAAAIPSRLAEALQEIKAAPASNVRTTREYRLVYALKAWNAFRLGVDHVDLRWDREAGEAFPQMKALPQSFDAYLSEAGREKRNRGRPRTHPTTEKTYEAALDKKSHVSFELVTPEQAEAILMRNGPGAGLNENRNRKQSAETIARYARDMAADAWLLNGQSIKISARGRLLDGQHRLAACVKSGKPFMTAIVYGLDEDVFATFDQGKKQTFASSLKKRGIKYPRVVEGISRVFWQWREFGLSGVEYPTIKELEAVFEANPDIEGSAIMASRPEYVELATAVAIGSMHYIGSLMDEDVTRGFFSRLGSGVGLVDGDPVLALRRRFIQDKTGKKGGRITERSRLILIAKAWLAAAEERSLKTLRFDPSDEFPRSFSMPVAAALDVVPVVEPTPVDESWGRWRAIPSSNAIREGASS